MKRIKHMQYYLLFPRNECDHDVVRFWLFLYWYQENMQVAFEYFTR